MVPQHSSWRFLTIRSGYLPRLCRNCKHFYPTLHHLLITCPSTFLKGARKTLRNDLRDAISSPLRSQLQALLPGFLGRIDFLLLDWDMQDFGELYGPLSSITGLSGMATPYEPGAPLPRCSIHESSLHILELSP